MVDQLYSDPRLVALYDTLNPWGDDNDFYLRLPTKSPSRILDVGCGTGMLAVKYAELGHNVVGVDPAEEMINAAKAREAAETVEWHTSDLNALKAEHDFDLIVMTGHAFQCLVTDHEIRSAFGQIRHLLAHGGRFVFETRNPEARAWQRWTPEHSRTRVSASDGTLVSMHHQVTEMRDDLVTFKTVYAFANAAKPIESRSTLRFPTLAAIEQLAKEQGLAITQVFGDWDQSPLDHNSPEIISVLTLKSELA